jgi:hypothetical protein
MRFLSITEAATRRAEPQVTSEQDFVAFLLRCVLDSSDIYEEDNIDSSYPAPGAGLGPGDRMGAQLRYLNFVMANRSRLYRSLCFLQDHDSRSLFLALILFRIVGYRRIKLPEG